MTTTPSDFRVVIFSSGDPAQIARLVRRIDAEVPGARVCGVLSERRPRKPLAKRVTSFLRNLRDPAFVRFAIRRIGHGSRDRALGAGRAVLDLVHAGRPAPAPAVDLEELGSSLGFAVRYTTDYHAEESLAFVRRLAPDLGIVYGTRILKPSLFTIPRHGSINIHKRKVPDYRGGGPIGLWEMLDGQTEIGVTVHEVTEKLDAGHVVNAATIPIEPFDTLTSLALKAHVIGNDLLVRSVGEYAAGTVRYQPQQGTGKMFRSPTPVQLAEHERVLAGLRPGYRAPRSRTIGKLLAKTALGMPAAAVGNWRRRLRGSHPVRILFHHVVADRPHRMGISTDEFYRHVQFLRRHYRIVSLHDALDMLRAGRVSEPTVVLTFDDGYRDNFLTLRAIVEETGVPITLFVSSEHMTTGREFAHDIRASERGFAPLTWEELAQMQREGFEIGSHTRTHFDCGSRERGRLSGEIAGSKRELEQRLRVPIDLFSFPGGLPANMSPEAMALAAQGYRCVLSAFGGTNEPGQDLRHLKRWFHASHRWELELQLQGVLEREPAFTWQPDAAPATIPTLSDAVVSARGA